MSDTSQGPGWWQASDGKWYPPQPAAQPAAAAPAAGQSTPTEAIVSLVLGILGIVLCCWGIGIILGGVGLYLSMAAKKKIAASNGTLGGAGLAQGGMITSIIALALGVIGLLWLIVSIVTGSGSFYFSTS